MPINVLFFLSIICFFTKQIHAQSHGFDTLNGGYYSYVSKAELAIVDSAFYTADSLFKVAFSVSKRSFGQDFFLVAFNATKLCSNTLVLNYLKESIQHGIQFPQIKKNKELKEYFILKDINISKKSTLCYKQLRKEYLSQLNMKMRKKISRLVFNDQAARIIPGFFLTCLALLVTEKTLKRFMKFV